MPRAYQGKTHVCLIWRKTYNVKFTLEQAKEDQKGE